MDLIPDEDAAREWFEARIWPNGRHCPRCGSVDTAPSTHRRMPYWCSGCKSYFSVRIGTVLQDSKVPLRKWALAIYLHLTSLKGVSSLKLHRDIGVSQKAAWFMLHRLREAGRAKCGLFSGPVEFDETYFGGRRKNMSNTKRRAALKTGRGPVGKTTVVGAKDRATKQVEAKVIKSADGETLKAFVVEKLAPEGKAYTDEAKGYKGIPREHETVRHSVREYVRGQRLTPTGSSPSGRCSSAATWAPITR